MNIHNKKSNTLSASKYLRHVNLESLMIEALELSRDTQDSIHACLDNLIKEHLDKFLINSEDFRYTKKQFALATFFVDADIFTTQELTLKTQDSLISF
jgi:hypothetical protein